MKEEEKNMREREEARQREVQRKVKTGEEKERRKKK